jgi:hypothetical protein
MTRMISWGPSVVSSGEYDRQLAEHVAAAWDRGLGIALDALAPLGRDADAIDESSHLDD